MKHCAFLFLVVSVFLFTGSRCFSQSHEERFESKLAAWKTWYEAQLNSSFACRAETRFSDGSQARKEMIRDGRKQFAISRNTVLNGKKTFSTDLSNPFYLASLGSQMEGKWLITDLVEPTYVDFKRLRKNIAGEFEGMIGSGLYYLEPKGVIESIVGFGDSNISFDLSLRTSAYPVDVPEYRPLPNRMIVTFGEFNLPIEMRLHCTFRDFNFAVKNEYRNIDGMMRLIKRQEFDGFADLLEKKLLDHNFVSTYSDFRELNDKDLEKCKLSYYGLPEPKTATNVTSFRTWIMLALATGTIAFFVWIYIRRARG